MSAVPLILAIDCATDQCSVALARGAQVTQNLQAVGPGHSQVVLPMIDALLAGQAVPRSALDAIAFGAGPGAFTGLRVACGIAQGLGFGLDRPVVPVGNLEALAWLAFKLDGAAQRVLTAIDARMGEVYCAVWQRGPLPLAVHAPVLARPADLPALFLEARCTLAAGNALAVFAAATAGLDPAACAPALQADAVAIAAVARLAMAAGRAVPAADARPLYVRDRVALTTAERTAMAAA